MLSRTLLLYIRQEGVQGSHSTGYVLRVQRVGSTGGEASGPISFMSVSTQLPIRLSRGVLEGVRTWVCYM